MLRDYPYYDDYMKELEEEIRFPMLDPDENIGGGRSSMKQEFATDTLIRIEDDKRLRQLAKQQMAISTCLTKSRSPYIRTICNELYFKKHKTLTLQGVADKLFIDKSRVSRHRNKFIEMVAKELGLGATNAQYKSKSTC